MAIISELLGQLRGENNYRYQNKKWTDQRGDVGYKIKNSIWTITTGILIYVIDT